GLTHQEFPHYRTLVQGQKTWNTPRDNAFSPAYIRNHVSDGAFDVNNTVGNQIYVGPDGVSFNNALMVMSVMATEIFLTQIPQGLALAQPKENTGPLVAFFYSAMTTKDTTSNETFSRDLDDALIKSLLAGSLSDASIHVPIPRVDTWPYLGGQDMSVTNAVIKPWLNEGDSSISEVRSSQIKLDNPKLRLDDNLSFIVFLRNGTRQNIDPSVCHSVLLY
ncbi:hypothetical protein LZ30DRAFT_583573, partial [Colletotrichum cereale]